jgi:Amt family ammonium transporter
VLYGSEKFIGMMNVGKEPNPVYAPTIPHSLFCVYQMMFAAITPAIISGARGERMKFTTDLVFLLIWTTVVYDPVAHWIWAAWYEVDSIGETITKYGWLRQLGSLDFAGGTAVHISSGVSAMIAGIVLPKRKKSMKKPPNVGFVLLGTALLWFGWFGFNAGSALVADGLASHALITTHTAAATGFLTWTVLDLIVKQVVKPAGAACGAVIGLVAVTPAAGFVHIPSGIAFGIIPVIIIYFWLILRSKYLIKYLPGEDTLDVFAAHGLGGILGCLMVGFFASKEINSLGLDGVFFGGKGWLLGYQISAILSVAAYSALLTFIILKLLHYTVGLTYSLDVLSRIDIHQHGANLTNHNLPNSPKKKNVVIPLGISQEGAPAVNQEEKEGDSRSQEEMTDKNTESNSPQRNNDENNAPQNE